MRLRDLCANHKRPTKSVSIAQINWSLNENSYFMQMPHPLSPVIGEDIINDCFIYNLKSARKQLPFFIILAIQLHLIYRRGL